MTIKINKNGIWQIKNALFYDQYNKTCHPVKRRYFVNKEIKRLIGESTAGGTIYIIQKFKPNVWVIENPLTSKIWKFQEYHWNFVGHMNKTCYSDYDKKFSLKPTIFKSNIKLNLRNNRKKGNKNHMSLGSYSKRSSIPFELIKEIMTEILIKLEGSNNE